MIPRVAALSAVLALGLAIAPVAARAQPAAGLHRIGYLSPGFPPTASTPVLPLTAFRNRLAELGYVEGQTFVMELGFAKGAAERLPALAAELVRLRPSVIVAVGSSATAAAKGATATIPIVMAASLDPVRDGLVQSLARPGGNVTGVTQTSDAELIAKRLQLAKELIPTATRLALVPPPRPWTKATENWLSDAQAAARAIGFTTQTLEVHDLRRWDQVFAEATRARTDLVHFVSWAPYITYRRQIAEQALRSRMPTVFGTRVNVEAGGLLSYGTNPVELNRRAADYADRILRGTRPADLPVEQPTTFELVINVKTAKALGLTVPPSILARADQVIEQ